MNLPDITTKNEELRLQYLSLIGQMAKIDGKFDPTEKTLLEKMMTRFQLSEKYKKQILETETVSKCQIKRAFDELKENRLHHSFMLDLIAMATADGRILDSEHLMLSHISRLIGLRCDEFYNLINFAQATSKLSDDNHNDPMFQYVIEMFFNWARKKNVELFKQTTFAIDDSVDSLLKADL